MGATLQINDIHKAVSEFWRPFSKQLKENPKIFERAKIALAIDVWRRRNEHRVKFFLAFAIGSEEEKKSLGLLLEEIEISQSLCEKLPDLESTASDVFKWILNYFQDCSEIEQWEEKLDGLDNTAHLLNSFSELFATSPFEDDIESIRTSITQLESTITTAIQRAFKNFFRQPFASPQAFVSAFEQHCKEFPCDSNTLILERALGTHLPVGTKKFSEKYSHSVHESIPWNSLKQILTNSYFDPTQTYIDVGSGTGTLAIAIALCSSVQITGIDIVPSFVDIARNAAKFHSASADFFVKDALDIDFNDFQNAILFSTLNGEPLKQLKQNMLRSKTLKHIWTVGFISNEFTDIGWKIRTGAATEELDLQLLSRP